MISGTASKIGNLSGNITAKETLNGYINRVGGLTGKVSVSVKDVPYYETSNDSGGTTVYIGKEVVDNGSK